MLRSEALLTSRPAHCVCYPGTSHRSRIVTVRAGEYEHGQVLLNLCRTIRPLDRATLQVACVSARAALRSGATAAQVFETARSHGLLRDDAPGSALADASADGNAMGPFALETCETEPMPCARTPRRSPPPLPPPSEDPGMESPAMSSLVARGKNLWRAGQDDTKRT
jgi:hypothetical protein